MQNTNHPTLVTLRTTGPAGHTTHKQITTTLWDRALREHLYGSQHGVAQPTLSTRSLAEQLYFVCRYPNASRLTRFLSQHNIPLNQALMALKVAAVFGYEKNMQAILQHYAPDMDIGNLRADANTSDEQIIITLAGWLAVKNAESTPLAPLSVLLQYMTASGLLLNPLHLGDINITDEDKAAMQLSHIEGPIELLIDGQTDTLTFYLETQKQKLGIDSDEYKSLIKTGLLLTCDRGFTDTLMILIQQMPPSLTLNEQLGEFDGTALMCAASSGHTDIVNTLIQAGADVNQHNYYGFTALIQATGSGHTNIVNALIQAGADVNQHDDGDHTALMCAAASCHIDIIDVLLQQPGININYTNEDNDTALTCAAHYGQTDSVNALLQAGANVDHAEEGGYTALMFAADYGHTDIINILIQAGANVNLADIDGDTALMMAEKKGHTECADLIRQKMHQTNRPTNDRLTAVPALADRPGAGA